MLIIHYFSYAFSVASSIIAIVFVVVVVIKPVRLSSVRPNHCCSCPCKSIHSELFPLCGMRCCKRASISIRCDPCYQIDLCGSQGVTGWRANHCSCFRMSQQFMTCKQNKNSDFSENSTKKLAFFHFGDAFTVLFENMVTATDFQCDEIDNKIAIITISNCVCVDRSCNLKNGSRKKISFFSIFFPEPTYKHTRTHNHNHCAYKQWLNINERNAKRSKAKSTWNRPRKKERVKKCPRSAFPRGKGVFIFIDSVRLFS